MKLSFHTLHEKGWFKSTAALTAFAVSAVGLFSALRPYFQPSPAVTSPPVHAQAAPATAGQRTVDGAFGNRISHELGDKDANVLVVAARGDDEAGKYAREILDYLKQQGYRNAALSVTSFPSLHGVDIEKNGNRAFIKVGHQ